MVKHPKVGADRPDPERHGQRSRAPVLIGLLENHRLLRERLADLLERQPGLHVVASADATAGGVERLQEAHPQVVVIGSTPDGKVCRDCLRGIREGLPDVRVVVMNVTTTSEDLLALIEEGASGLLLPEATLDEFLQTIRLVSGGTDVFPPRLVPLLFAQLAGRGIGSPAPGGGDPQGLLTHREGEVGSLIAEGFGNQSIADRLGISLHTVKSHVAKILEKLHLHSRLQIAVHFNRDPGSRPPVDPLHGVPRQ